MTTASCTASCANANGFLAFPVGPQLLCPTKLQVREGERLSCEVRGNPPPLVTWYRNGQAVVLPAHSSREHAGKYTALARGPLEPRNFTVEVEILGGRGRSGASLHCRRAKFRFISSSSLQEVQTAAADIWRCWRRSSTRWAGCKSLLRGPAALCHTHLEELIPAQLLHPAVGFGSRCSVKLAKVDL